MRNLFLIVGLLLAYTFIYAGLSHFGTNLTASPGAPSKSLRNVGKGLSGG